MDNVGNIPADWARALDEHFRGPRGILGERLQLLIDAERVAEYEGIASCNQFAKFGDTFFDFTIQTLDLLALTNATDHQMRVPLLLSSVSRLRSSYILFWKGYYFDAFSLLRGVLENAVHLSADANGWLSISSWFDSDGIDFNTSPRKIARTLHNRRVNHDREVEARVFRDKSGLSQADQDELAMLFTVMHSHVHKTEMHFVYAVSTQYRTKTPASILPKWDDNSSSHYQNIFCACAWMFIRLISFANPVLQRTDNWMSAHNAIDNAMRAWFAGWDKPLSGTVIRLIDAKFTFVGEWPVQPTKVSLPSR